MSHTSTPRLSLQQAGVVAVVWLALLMLPLAPLGSRFSAAGVLLFLAIAFGTRNIFAIGATAAFLNLAARFFNQVSSFHDQHWVQWSSISALLTGHNLFSTSPLYRYSLSSYMPAGDLFGGLFIALGIHRYWLVWHVLVVCLIALPLVLSPSFATLLLFVGLACFYPFSDYTAGGGTIEIAYALLVGAIALFRSHRLVTPSLVLFAFAAMFRQPSVVLIPFILLVLWRRRSSQKAIFFVVLLFVFGGLYIVAEPSGAYRYLYGVWDGYHQELYNVTPGLRANYSVSSIPGAFGIPDQLPWYGWKGIYLPLMLIGLGGLFGAAWFRRSDQEVLLLGVLASAQVYVVSRGYTQFAYLCTAFFPLIAFAYPVRFPNSPAARRFGQGLALLFLWIGAAPAVLFAGAWIFRQLDELRPPRVIRAVTALEIPLASAPVAIPPLNGDDANRHVSPLSAAVQFQLPQPEYLTGIRLACDHVPIDVVKGVVMPYPTDTQMRGAITEGIIEGSENGADFSVILHFKNAATYCNWPTTIRLPATPRPLTAIRIKALKLYLDQEEWILGNVEFLTRP